MGEVSIYDNGTSFDNPAYIMCCFGIVGDETSRIEYLIHCSLSFANVKLNFLLASDQLINT